MAEFSKYKAFAIGRLFQHNNRTADDGVTHSNKEIDNERTYLNYHLKKGNPDDVTNRLQEVFHIKRKDLIALAEMIVTLPRDVKYGDERAFFNSVYDFYCNDLGEQNIMNAVVHNDETRPHIHIDFVPVIKQKVDRNDLNNVSNHGGTFKKMLRDWCNEHEGDEVEIVCCQKKINRAYLQTMHPRLSTWVERELGYETEILNGVTDNHNKSILELKVGTLKENVARLEARNEALKKEFQAFTSFVKRCGFTEQDIGLLPMMQRVEDLENQNQVYREIISRHRYAFTKDDLMRMKEKRYTATVGATVSVFSGAMDMDNVEDNAIVLIELPYQVKRESPQQRIINEDDDLLRQSKLVQANPNKVMMRPSRISDRMYLFIKTDNANQTIACLLELEKHLKEIDLRGRKMHMEKIETDEYNFAKNVMEKLDIPTNYYMKHSDNSSKEKEMTKEI